MLLLRRSGSIVTKDPQELDNLASDPSFDSDLNACLKFYENYRETAVADLTISKGDADPAADPSRRSDLTWGPFVNSTQCKW